MPQIGIPLENQWARWVKPFQNLSRQLTLGELLLDALFEIAPPHIRPIATYWPGSVAAGLFRPGYNRVDPRVLRVSGTGVGSPYEYVTKRRPLELRAA
jgi:hypothetical protein